MPGDPRPICVVTGALSPYRREPFRLLAEAQGAEVLAFADAGPPVPGLAVHRTTQAAAALAAGSGRYRAVISSLGGRVALPATYAAARGRGIPFVLWATIWAHPRTPAHALSLPATRFLYRNADAVLTYGKHVSRHVQETRGARGKVFVAPQAVDVEHFGAEVPGVTRDAARTRAGAGEGQLLVLYVGRLEEEKGVRVLLDAWGIAALGESARLAVAGRGSLEGLVEAAGPGVRSLGYVGESELPGLYAAADILVVPSIRTATFTEPWGLVVNEAMLQGTTVIASDAVGAAAGGLLRDGRTGLAFAAGDAGGLAARLKAAASEPGLRDRLGTAGGAAARELTPAAWAAAAGQALAAVGAAR